MRQHIVPDLTGKKFGTLNVIKRVSNLDYKYSSWLCKCDCGKEIITRGTSLRSGNTKSCGCRRARSQKHRFKPFASTLTQISRIDKTNQRETMTYEEFLTFTKLATCYYCGRNLVWRTHQNRHWNLDRIDIKTNCVPCCSLCNRMKSNMIQNEFISHCQKIVNHAGNDTSSLSEVKRE
jgi:hypothetical protein